MAEVWGSRVKTEETEELDWTTGSHDAHQGKNYSEVQAERGPGDRGEDTVGRKHGGQLGATRVAHAKMVPSMM